MHEGDMPASEFRAAAGRAIELVASYLEETERWPVLARVRPGDLAAELPERAPELGEPFDVILDDYERLIPPATTHWNHPGFMAYFGITGSGPGIIGELLAAALNVNAMLWRTGPAQTELEEVTLGWLLDLLGLEPGRWDGTINDTASTSTLYALAAAREMAGLDIRARGMAGRADLPALRVYCSEEAHSSVDKAAITLGLGTDGVRRVATDDGLRLDPTALRRAVREDREAGHRPLAVIATVGTTSTTAVDPVPAIADVCDEEGMWLHVDAAYGGAAAVMPELRHVLDGCERAHSLVVNPHKWLFVPIDCSALYTSRPDLMRQAFSLVPVYLESGGERNLMDYGVALGRRFRALKLWFVLRYFGGQGIADRLREHVRLARHLADRIQADAAFELLAPVGFSVVVFRHRAPDLAEPELERRNRAILERVNASGEVFLSHTRVRGVYALRVAIGNLRTRERHVDRAWELVRTAAAGMGPTAPPTA